MPKSSLGTLAEAKERFHQSMNDPETVKQFADHLSQEIEVDRLDEDKKGIHYYNRKPPARKFPPIPGNHSPEVENKIYNIVALRARRKNDHEIEDELGFSRGYTKELQKTHPELFDACQANITKVILVEYAQNLLLVKSALAESGHIAVQALADIASDKKQSGRNRADAARYILDLIDFKSVVKGDAVKEVASSMRDVVKTVVDGMKSTPYIVEVEDTDEADVVFDQRGN